MASPNLRDALFASIEASKPLKKESQRQFFCIQQLEQFVGLLGPGWHVKPFGSAANSFLTRGGDLDVTCFHESVQDQDTSRAAHELQHKLLPLLSCHPRFKIVEEIWTARVPIVKLMFDETMEVDLSCHNPQALQNTYLLKAYAELDEQVRNLVLAAKLWAKSEGVSGAPGGHLSSYSLTLMALYFLQVEVGMPCLNTAAFSSKGSAPEVDNISWACGVNLVDLVTRFFAFFAGAEGGFQWGREVISVRKGRRLATNGLDFAMLPGRLTSRLHIEDPFLLARNLNCVLSLENEQLLRVKLGQAASTMYCGGIPNAFVPDAAESLASDTDVDASTTISTTVSAKSFSDLGPHASESPDSRFGALAKPWYQAAVRPADGRSEDSYWKSGGVSSALWGCSLQNPPAVATHNRLLEDMHALLQGAPQCLAPLPEDLPLPSFELRFEL